MPLLVVSVFLDYLMFLIGSLCAGAFAFLSFRLFIKPALKIRAAHEAPPQEGYQNTIILKNHESNRRLRIGQLDADINLRLQGIKEDHLIIKFRRYGNLEEYDINIQPSGAVFFRAPHTRRFEMLKKEIQIPSSELVGHPGSLQVAAQVIDGRPFHYVEFELSSEYFYDKDKEEKIKFMLTVVKVSPPYDIDSNKKGIYMFRASLAQHEDTDVTSGEE